MCVCVCVSVCVCVRRHLCGRVGLCSSPCLHTMLRALVADERPRAYGHRFLLRRVRARILTHSHLQEAILNGGSSGAISEVSPEVSPEVSQVPTEASRIRSTEGSLDQVTAGSGMEKEPVPEARSFVSSGGSFALEQASRNVDEQELWGRWRSAEYVSNSGDSESAICEISSSSSFALPASPCQLLAGPYFVSGEGTDLGVRDGQEPVRVNDDMPPPRICSDEHVYQGLPAAKRRHDAPRHMTPFACHGDACRE